MKPRLHVLESAPLPCLLRLPAARDDAASAAGAWPTLCFLHGHDEGPPTPLRTALTRHGPLRRSSAAAAARFIIVAPQLPLRGDNWHRFGDEVREVVRQVRALHGGDPARTCLTGFSFGGNGVFDIALQQRQAWAALWAVDPTRAPRVDPDLPVWLSSGPLSRRTEGAFRRTLHVADAGAPGAARVLHDYGLDHVGTATAAYADDAPYLWLLRQWLPVPDREGEHDPRGAHE